MGKIFLEKKVTSLTLPSTAMNMLHCHYYEIIISITVIIIIIVTIIIPVIIIVIATYISQ